MSRTSSLMTVFLVNMPVSLIVITLLLRHLPPAAERLRGPGRSQLADAALLAGACGALLAGLTLATGHGIAWLALLLPALALLAAWLRRPDGRAVRAMATPGIRASLSALALLATAGSGVQYLMPFFMIRFQHASAVHTGFTVLAYPLAMGLTAPAGGLLADRWSAPRTAVTGAWLVAVADLLLVSASIGSRPVDLSWRLALVGLGMGLFSGPNQTTIMNLAPRDALATAGAAAALTRSLGFALGPALCTAIWAASGYSAAGLSMALVLPVTGAATAGITLGASSLLPRLPHRHRTQPRSVRVASTPVRSEK
jgi:Major Facilitator Superfamily